MEVEVEESLVIVEGDCFREFVSTVAMILSCSLLMLSGFNFFTCVSI